MNLQRDLHNSNIGWLYDDITQHKYVQIVLVILLTAGLFGFIVWMQSEEDRKHER